MIANDALMHLNDSEINFPETDNGEKQHLQRKKVPL